MKKNIFYTLKFRSIALLVILLVGKLYLHMYNSQMALESQNIINWNSYSLETNFKAYSLYDDISELQESGEISQEKIRRIILLTKNIDNRFEILKSGSKDLQIKKINNQEIDTILVETQGFWKIIKENILKEKASFFTNRSRLTKINNDIKTLIDALSLQQNIINSIIENNFKDAQKTQFAYSSILLAIVIMISIFAFNAFRRIGVIISRIKYVNEGSYDHPIAITGRDEVSDLSHNFNLMMMKLKSTTVSSSYFESVINSIDSYIFDIDKYGNVFKANEKANRLNQDSKSFNILKRIVPKKENVKELTSTINASLPLKLKLDDGETIFIRASISEMEKVYNEPHYILTLTNIDKEKEVEAQLQQSSKLASIGELAAGIAHEINNPLTVLYGDVKKIQKLDKENQFEKSLERMNANINRIKNIVKGLKVFSRNDSLKEKDYEFLITDAISDTLDLVSELYKNEKVTIFNEVDFQNVYIKGAQSQFQQVLLNFISNAKDAILTHKTQGEIWIRGEFTNKEVHIKIHDNGCGIPESIKEKIFQSFFTTKAPGKGTGLGMSISLKIIKDMGGLLDIQSIENQGTTIIVKLPAYLKEQSQEKVVEQDNKQLLKKQFQGKLALVVDDEIDIREIIAEQLTELYGLITEEAENGSQAFDKIKEKHYDFLFTDIQMPVLDGLELLKKIKENRIIINKVVITGGAKSQVQIEEIQMYSDQVIKKPIIDEDLDKAMEYFISEIKKAA